MEILALLPGLSKHLTLWISFRIKILTCSWFEWSWKEVDLTNSFRISIKNLIKEGSLCDIYKKSLLSQKFSAAGINSFWHIICQSIKTTRKIILNNLILESKHSDWRYFWKIIFIDATSIWMFKLNYYCLRCT